VECKDFFVIWDSFLFLRFWKTIFLRENISSPRREL
jgi:hypothetical protein